MNNNVQRGVVYENQGSPQQGGFKPSGSGGSLGHTQAISPKLGTGGQRPEGVCVEVNQRIAGKGLGGQHRIGLFGVTLGKAPAPQVATLAPVIPPQAHKAKASRIKGALNSFDTDGLNPAHYTRQFRATVPAGRIDPDALERAEWEEEDARARAQATATMEAAARAAAKREEYEWYTTACEEQEESYAAFLGQWFPHIQAIMEEGGAQ